MIPLIILITFTGCSINQNNIPPNADKEVLLLVHGFGRSKFAMRTLNQKFQKAGYYVVSVDYSSFDQNVDQIKKEVFEQINSCCEQLENKTHFVGHSLGGLLIRSYLEEHKPKNMGRVVLIGSPNKGSEIVDYFKDRCWFALGGPTAFALGTDSKSFPNSLKDPDYPVGVIAGVSKLPFSEDILKGDDDGMVTVESAKLKGMTDFVLLKVNHSMMRYDDDVANQSIQFLKTGQFSKSSTLNNKEEK